MMSGRHIEFGVKATGVALAAKQGICRDLDRLDLAMSCLDLAADDVDAVAAVKEFCAASQVDRVAAGNALLDFVQTWRQDTSNLGDKKKPEFDWQKRRDLNG